MGGRKPTVAPGELTVAEQALVAVARRLLEREGRAPTTAAIAREAEWSRQRAHALVLRCEAKGAVARVANLIELREMPATAPAGVA